MTGFVDTNIPTYAEGAPSIYKEPCLAVLGLAAGKPGTCLTSAMVLQELLYVRLRRAGIVAARLILVDFDNALNGLVEAVSREDVWRSAQLDLPTGLSGADRVHIAVMQRLGMSDIITTDRDFDGINGIRRLDPLDLAIWRDSVFGDG